MAIEVAEGCGPIDHESGIYGCHRSHKEIIWMRDFIGVLGMQQGQFRLHCDNQSVIHLGKNVAYHSRTKHIQYHWLRERVEERDFILVKIHTNDKESNMLAKVLPLDKLSACR